MKQLRKRLYKTIRDIQICLFSLITFSSACLGQNSMTISGKILDKENLEPILYAHIYLKGGSAGTVSNINGEFDFHIPIRFRKDTLVISSVGYKVFSTSLSSTSNPAQRVFYLEPATLLLEGFEILQKKVTALEVIKKALEKIPENYPSDPYILSGFYRDWKTVDFTNVDQDRDLLLEAAVNIYDPGYFLKGKKKFEETYIKEIRRSELPEKPKDGTGWNYYNSLFGSILTNNYIKYSNSVDPSLDDAPLLDFPNSYSFTFHESVVREGLIAIKATHPEHPLVYEIYIDDNNYAFTRIDLINDKIVEQGDREYQLGRINNTQRFRKSNGKWYLTYKRMNWEVTRINPGTKEIIFEEEYLKELLVNKIHELGNGDLPNDLGQLMDRKKPLEFQVQPYNEDFWENYNIVKDNPLTTYSSSTKSDNWSATQKFNLTGLEESNDHYKIPEQIDEKFQWNFNREDSLLGGLNPMRSCYDVIFYELDIDIDPESETLKGSTKINFLVLEESDRIQIDLDKNLLISSIWHDSDNLKFTREYNSVFVDLPSTLAKGSTQNIIVNYEGKPLDPLFRIPQYGAFVWTNDSQGNPWIQSVCQGSGPNGWWPNKDHISDKADSALINVKTPTTLMNISNGRLLEQRVEPDGKTSYKWKVSYPILNYNVAVNVGDYKHSKDIYVGNDTLTLDFFVLKADQKEAETAFKIVKPMLEVYEDYFGNYPFYDDGFKLVQTPIPMEHQSCIAIGRDFNEDILLHETAHEWWGNSVSCTDLAELWIHEAFATYSVLLFKEKYYSKDESLIYLDFLRRQVKNEHPILGIHGVKHIHYDYTDMYSKGALMLHTLRNVIANDSLWFGILKSIQHDFKYEFITTQELIEYINQKTGEDYSYFFNQYLTYTSLPELQISIENKKGETFMNYRWVTEEPNFHMPVKVMMDSEKFKFIYPNSKWQSIQVDNSHFDAFRVDEGFYINLKREE